MNALSWLSTLISRGKSFHWMQAECNDASDQLSHNSSMLYIKQTDRICVLERIKVKCGVSRA